MKTDLSWYHPKVRLDVQTAASVVHVRRIALKLLDLFEEALNSAVLLPAPLFQALSRAAPLCLSCRRALNPRADGDESFCCDCIEREGLTRLKLRQDRGHFEAESPFEPSIPIPAPYEETLWA